ncbi:Carboxymuconolactone decarboxylase family protein [compost metagenome]
MPNSEELSPVRKLLGDFAPKFAELTEEVLLGDVWTREELSPRDRSLISVSSLITGGDTEALRIYLNGAKANGLSEEELIEVITHLAFYAGWPKAMSAIRVAKEVFSKEK